MRQTGGPLLTVDDLRPAVRVPLLVKGDLTYSEYVPLGYAAELVGVAVFMASVPTTAGSYTLDVKLVPSGTSVLDGGAFDLTSLTDLTAQALTLTGEEELAALDTLEILVSSDNVDIDMTGSGLLLIPTFRRVV